MSKPTRDDLPADLKEWAELLARHHRSLRRPYATGRPLLSEADQLGDDRQQQDGADDREKDQRSAPQD